MRWLPGICEVLLMSHPLLSLLLSLSYSPPPFALHQPPLPVILCQLSLSIKKQLKNCPKSQNAFGGSRISQSRQERERGRKSERGNLLGIKCTRWWHLEGAKARNSLTCVRRRAPQEVREELLLLLLAAPQPDTPSM